MTKRHMVVILALSCAFTFAGRAQSQNTSAGPVQKQAGDFAGQYFRLTFRVIQISPEGKVVDSRAYTISTGEQQRSTSSIRTGDKVPVTVKTGETHYLDVGTNIDVNFVRAENSTVQIYVMAHLTTLSTVPPAPMDLPAIRETSWSGPVMASLGKPMIIFSSDNNADRGKIELELAAASIEK
jgi:hypothetical protein